MSYNVYITRATEITQEEWDALVANDRELTARDAHMATATNPKTGEVISIPAPASATWADANGDAKAYFWFRDGKVTAKSPSDDVIDKMTQIAALLGAKVRGEEGEFY